MLLNLVLERESQDTVCQRSRYSGDCVGSNVESVIPPRNCKCVSPGGSKWKCKARGSKCKCKPRG